MEQTKHVKESHQTMNEQQEYTTRITLACDTGMLRYDPSNDSAQMLGQGSATLPPRLARYARTNGHEMPDGLYGFYGESANRNLYDEVLDHLKRREQNDTFLWDLETTLRFPCKPGMSKQPPSLVWRDPPYLQASFIRVSRISKQAADLLRFFTGDTNALDRLTLEPWRIDTYAAVLSIAYGPMKAIIFDALLDDGMIVPLVKIYDHSLLSGGELQPLYEILSARDPEAPKKFLPPGADWAGWGVKDVLSTNDIKAIYSYAGFFNINDNNQGKGSKASTRDKAKLKAFEDLKMDRVRTLRKEGRFLPRDEELKEIVERRLANIRGEKDAEAAPKLPKGMVNGTNGAGSDTKAAL